MSTALKGNVSAGAEALHIVALCGAAFCLGIGVVTGNTHWVNIGVSLILLLPPLRLATTIIGEARAQRFQIASLGVLVLAFVLLSRRIS